MDENEIKNAADQAPQGLPDEVMDETVGGSFPFSVCTCECGKVIYAFPSQLSSALAVHKTTECPFRKK